MTSTPDFPPTSQQPRLLLFLAYPGMGLLDASGPQTVFWAATKALHKRGLPGYDVHTASLAGGLMPTAEGLALQTAALADFAACAIDTIVVPGSPHIEQVLGSSQPLTDWLRHAAATARRTASVCSGAFLLAQAGLLDHRRAATHWAMCDMLRQRHPLIEVDADAIFLCDGTLWSSAGVSAGIDLALALVEADNGHAVAMDVARELVVYLKRPGGQSQFSELLLSQQHDGSPFSDLHLWISDNLGARLTVEALASRANMSARNFARMYKQKTGRAPAKAVEIFRLEAAKRLLEDSGSHVDQIAVACGFGDEERMRVTFQRNLGVAPRDYRKRFSR